MTIFLSDKARLFHADCRDVLRSLLDSTVDSVVTDPPYELNFMGKGWDDTGIANDPALWREVFRVLKPGAHLAAFSASRTYHRMTCAIEDAGFEIRDSLMWIYGTGFPKSQNVAKFVDVALGVEGGKGIVTGRSGSVRNSMAGDFAGGEYHEYLPGSDAAREWEGWGTALKPAFEPIVLARKPLSEKTVAANVLRWRTGALNIGACRVPTDETITATRNIALGSSSGGVYSAATKPGVYVQQEGGRWPANVVTDGSAEVVGMFPSQNSGKANPNLKRHAGGGVIYGECDGGQPKVSHGDSGSAARFFYSAKASKQDRNGSKHPTVKPISLMEWLATLITPPGGTILDPFAGSGTTGAAATNKGFNAILCEREAEYVADTVRRFVPQMWPWS
jgi:DNA modification methylase